MGNNEKDIKKNILNKMFLIYGAFVIVIFFILGQIVFLHTKSETEWEKDIKTVINEHTRSKRGDILSSDGYYLAASLPTYSAHWDLSIVKRDTFYKYIDTLAQCMSSYFKDKTKEEYKKEYTEAFENKKQYHKVKPVLTQEAYKTIQTFPIFKMRKGVSGFIKRTTFKRQTIESLMAKRTIGKAQNKNGEEIFNTGLEKAFNEYLQGKEQYILKHKIQSGQFVPYNIDDEERQDPGSDIISTINFNIQDIAEQCLLKQVKKYNAQKGTVVIMEVKTGKVRAMINLQRDNNSEEYSETINDAVGTRTEPGSTFKLASMIAILESGTFDINDTIDTGNGEFIGIPGVPIRDDHKGGLGKLTVKDVFAKSSNVGFAIMAIKAFNHGAYNYNDPLLNRTKLHNPENEKNLNYFIDRLCDLGIKQKLNIKIQGEEIPYLKYPGDKAWSAATLPQTAIGYELLITPLQTLTLYNAIANNGTMVRPIFAEQVKLYGVVTKQFETEIINPAICSQATIEKVQNMLENVVENGTASNIKSNNYRIAGKTGTAQIADGDKGYSKKKHQASFAGYFPAENPKYSMIVIITEPQGSIYGGQVAAPVFKNIADKLYTYDYDLHHNTEYNIASFKDKPSVPKTKIGNRSAVDRIYSKIHVELENADNSNTQWVYTQPAPDNRKMQMEAYSTPRGYIPDVIGMGLKDALYQLRQKNNITIKVIGHGTVVAQNPSPKTKIENVNEITIELK